MDILPKKGGGFTQSKRILSEKTENFSPKGVGSGPIQNFLNRKNLGIHIDGGGGLARSGKLKKKTSFYGSPKCSECVLLSDKDEEEMNARQSRRVCSPEWRVPGFPQPTNTQTNNQAAK